MASPNGSCSLEMIPSLPEWRNKTPAAALLAPRPGATDPQMVACCHPNPVHVHNNCSQWCEIPPQYLFTPANPMLSQWIFREICLLTNGQNLTVLHEGFSIIDYNFDDEEIQENMASELKICVLGVFLVFLVVLSIVGTFDPII
ncbi:oxidoreductase family protein [Colletotrichum asianum]|uniref:Oxidoreductase family protein n=1 Tax=Colletotrichum asianum TaxID=702518 RepID=A0A8H3WM15_9PEZI|nr:oxidoreductase family protein [Colletotrichum asianum]